MIAENKPQNDGLEDVRMLTVAALAGCLSVSVRQVYRMNRAELIPRPLQLGGCTRWRAVEIAAWLQVGSPARSEWEKQRDFKVTKVAKAGEMR